MNDYTIKPGDTLSKIARQYGTTVAELAKINNIKNVNTIFAGKTLKLKSDSPQINNNDAIRMLNDMQQNSQAQENISAQKDKTPVQNVFTRDANPPKAVKVKDGEVIDPFESIEDNQGRPTRIISRSLADGTVSSYTDVEYLKQGGTIETTRDANGELLLYAERNSKEQVTKTITKPGEGVFEEKLLDETGAINSLIRRDSNGEVISKINYERILNSNGESIGSILVSTENAKGTVIEQNEDFKPVLDSNGKRIGWIRKEPQDFTATSKPINDPRFQGLENYNFVRHAAKDGIGMITVNNENILIQHTNDNKYELTRINMKNQVEFLQYSSMEELKKALADKNSNFGAYAGNGYNDINYFFIP